MEQIPPLEIQTDSEHSEREASMWMEVYDRAMAIGRVKQATVGDWQFEYAVIDPHEGYEQYGRSRSGKPYQYHGRAVSSLITSDSTRAKVGFHTKGKSFVLAKEVRSAFRDFVGLHEFGEGVSQGIHPNTHAVACYLELTEVLKMSSRFQQTYANWIISNVRKRVKRKGDVPLSRGIYFGWAIKDYADTITEVLDKPMDQLPLDVGEKFLKKFYDDLEEKLRDDLCDKLQENETVHDCLKRLINASVSKRAERSVMPEQIEPSFELPEQKECTFEDGVNRAVHYCLEKLTSQPYVVIAVSSVDCKNSERKRFSVMVDLLLRYKYKVGCEVDFSVDQISIHTIKGFRDHMKEEGSNVGVLIFNSEDTKYVPGTAEERKALQDKELEEKSTAYGLTLSHIDLRVLIHKPDYQPNKYHSEFEDIIVSYDLKDTEEKNR